MYYQRIVVHAITSFYMIIFLTVLKTYDVMLCLVTLDGITLFLFQTVQKNPASLPYSV